MTSAFISYGEEITSTNNDTYKFAQLYRDSDSGLDYAKARFYASGIGRFLTPDLSTTGLHPDTPQSWNRYGYVIGNPVNGTDISGRDYCFDASGPCDDGGCGYADGDPLAYLETPGCDDGGGGGPAQPVPLDCEFVNWQALPGQIAGNITAYGPNGELYTGTAFVDPMTLYYSATGGGGAGSYTWNVSQTISGTGTVTYTGGTLNGTFPTQADPTLPGMLTQYSSSAAFTDVPGLWLNAPLGSGPSEASRQPRKRIP